MKVAKTHLGIAMPSSFEPNTVVIRDPSQRYWQVKANACPPFEVCRHSEKATKEHERYSGRDAESSRQKDD